jgi:hypothetical protein
MSPDFFNSASRFCAVRASTRRCGEVATFKQSLIKFFNKSKMTGLDPSTALVFDEVNNDPTIRMMSYVVLYWKLIISVQSNGNAALVGVRIMVKRQSINREQKVW